MSYWIYTCDCPAGINCECDRTPIKTNIELHPDGVKEVKCDFCDKNCGNDHCYTNTKDEQ